MSISTLLTVLFVGLKLGGVIDWGWLLVLSPVITYVCLCVLIGVCSYYIEKGMK